MKIAELNVKLLNPEAITAYLVGAGNFASVCYDTDTSKIAPEKIGNHVLQAPHWAAARASYFIFKVSGMSRIVTQQVLRHSIGVATTEPTLGTELTWYENIPGIQFNQRSQRYVDETEPYFIVPDSIVNNTEALDAYLDLMTHCWTTYDLLGKLGIPGDDKRLCLPNGCASEFNIALTPQALAHFCNERHCNRAGSEIRAMSIAMASQVIAIEAAFKPLLVAKCDKLGYCPEAARDCCGRRMHRDEAMKLLGHKSL